MMAQNEMLDARYRMGRRVRRMELLLEKSLQDGPMLRKVSGALQPAVMQFFSGNFQGVLRNVDAAYLSLVNADPAGPLARLLALDVICPKVLDNTERSFVAKIDVAYGSKLANGEVRCRWKGMSDWQDATSELKFPVLPPSGARTTPVNASLELACGAARLEIDVSALRMFPRGMHRHPGALHVHGFSRCWQVSHWKTIRIYRCFGRLLTARWKNQPGEVEITLPWLGHPDRKCPAVCSAGVMAKESSHWLLRFTVRVAVKTCSLTRMALERSLRFARNAAGIW